MATYRDGDITKGAEFVYEYGIGPGDREIVKPNYEELGLDEVEAANHLADVVALCEYVLEELARATGGHDVTILHRLASEPPPQQPSTWSTPTTPSIWRSED